MAKIVPGHITYTVQKIKGKEKNAERSQRGKNILPMEELYLIYSHKSYNRKRVNEIFKVLTENPHQPRAWCPAKLSFKSKGEIKNF